MGGGRGRGGRGRGVMLARERARTNTTKAKGGEGGVRKRWGEGGAELGESKPSHVCATSKWLEGRGEAGDGGGGAATWLRK